MSAAPAPHTPLRSLDAVADHIARHGGLRGAVVLRVADPSLGDLLATADVSGAILLGCPGPAARTAALVARGAVVFPDLGELPYDPYRAHLYAPEELYAGFDGSDPATYLRTLDARIHAHWVATGRDDPPLVEALARRLHDLALLDNVRELVRGRRCVAVMGGHALRRDDPAYADVARLAGRLARSGALLVSGGGPGAMEATHLGAWLADRDADALSAALALIRPAPGYRDAGWLATAFAVRRALPPPGKSHASLAIPTWLYGHEPPTPLATHVAKLFANSLREDGLVTVARHGIVFAPGSAGTVQEVFQDATQNHYGTLGEFSPMVFLGRRYWTEVLPVVPLLRALAADRPYAGHIGLVDDPDEAVDFLDAHPPVPFTPA